MEGKRGTEENKKELYIPFLWFKKTTLFLSFLLFFFIFIIFSVLLSKKGMTQ